MALVIKDRVRETTSTNGTGTITLTGAVLGYDSFLDVGDGNTTYYCIANPGTVEWEVGVGTYVLSGTSLVRNTVLSSSNANALVNFSAGVKDVFCTYPAGESVYLDSAGLVTAASGFGAGIPAFLATPTSANLKAAVTNETGSGALVFATSPVLVTPNLGTPSALVGTNITGTAAGLSIGGNAATATTATNQSGGSVNATTGAFSGALTSTSTIQTNAGYVASGVGSGATALTTNDGYGNANLTFNHINGTPDVTGSSARITSPVDGSAAAMDFQLASNTTSGVALPLATVMTLVPTQVSTQVPLSVTGNASATSFSGAGTGLTGTASGLSIGGNAATATTSTTATTATNATNTAITNDIATNATMYPTWVTATTGNLPQKTSSTKLTFNPSTGTLTTTTFSGSGASLTALNASNLSSGTVPDARISGSYTGLTNLTGTGNVDFSRFLGNAAGTVALPSFTWTGDITTGFYRPAASQLAVTIAGTQRGLFTSSGLNVNGLVATARIDTNNGTQLVLNAGESAGQATGQTDELIYLNAENGVQINSSPDNWATGWAARNTLTLCDPLGYSYFPSNVGIGITPTQKLHVSGNILATGSIDCGTQFLGLAADSATAPSFSFTGDTNTGIFQPGADQIGVTTGGTLRFTVNTTQLTSTLPIRGQNGSAAAPAFSASADTNTGMYFPAADTLGFVEGGVEAMRIASTGNVGIGKTNPSAKLDVSTNSTTAYGLISQTPTVGLVAGDYVNMAYITNSRGASNDGIRIVNVRDSTGSSTSDWQTESYRIRRSVDQSNGSSGVQEEIVFGQSILGFNTSGSERMLISSTGNVGIGTTSPAVKLDINGTDAIRIPVGTTAQQPTGAAGYLRFNSTTTQFEGYNGTTWSSVGGATINNDTTTASDLYPIFANATSGSATTVYTSNAKYLYKPSTGELSVSTPVASNGIVVNSQTMTASQTIAAGSSGFTVGPFSISPGAVLTVEPGARHVII